MIAISLAMSSSLTSGLVRPNKSVNTDAQRRSLPPVALPLGAGYVRR